MRRTFTLLLLTALALGVAACSADAPTPPAGDSEANGGPTTAGAGAAATAPEFELADLDGRRVKLSDSNGQVRLVDFWATWCAPCREEIPMLNALDEQYRDEGLTILAISDEKPDVVRAFAANTAIRYTNLVEAEGEVSGKYRVLGLPTAFLIDREGRIVETYFGPKPRRSLEKQIRALLDLPPAA